MPMLFLSATELSTRVLLITPTGEFTLIPIWQLRTVESWTVILPGAIQNPSRHAADIASIDKKITGAVVANAVQARAVDVPFIVRFATLQRLQSTSG